MRISLVKSNAEVLKQVAKPVTSFDSNLKRLAMSMYGMLLRTSAVGLAAPQIGKSIQFVVVSASADSYIVPKIIFMANPKIVYSSPEKTESIEFCLSLPGQAYKVKRPKVVTVEYQDTKGNHQLLTADGLCAKAISHELDHLKGILICDIGVKA